MVHPVSATVNSKSSCASAALTRARLLCPGTASAATTATSTSPSPGAGAAIGGFAVGYYSVLAVLTVPLVWGFRVVAAGRLRWWAVVVGALLTAASLSGFLQGFVLFLALPLDLGAPFGGLVVVGGAVAVGFWLFLLHLVVLAGWLFTQALDERLRLGHPASDPAVPAPPPAPRPAADVRRSA